MKFFIPNNIFERRVNSKQRYEAYVNKVKKDLNINTLKRIYINVLKYYDIFTFDYYVSYAFSLIKQWINQNEVYSEKYIVKLEENLKKLKIYNLLNALEEEYINHFKSVIFAKKRNLKKLIVDFPLEKIGKYKVYLGEKYIKSDESVYYNFENSDFYRYVNGELETVAKQIDVFISDIRLVISLPTKVYSFFLKEITSYKLTDKYFEFVYDKTKYYIDTEDNYVFYVSYERIFNLFVNDKIQIRFYNKKKSKMFLTQLLENK